MSHAVAARPARRLLTNGTIALASVLVALLVAELLARLVGVRPEFGQLLPLGGAPVRTVAGVPLWADKYPRYDRHDIDRARSDPDGFVVLGLGDSIMYGVLQPKEATYLEHARRQVTARSGRTVHVLNLATPGYNTRQENAAYLEIEDQIAPDLVIVHYWSNDMRQYRVVGGYVVDYGDISADGRFVYRALPLPDPISDFLLIHSRAYDLLTQHVVRYRRRTESNEWGAVSKPLADIHDRVRRGGGRLLVLVSPQMTGPSPESIPDRAMLSALAAERGFEVIDLAEWLQGLRSADLSLDGSHFTAEGHGVLGDRLADYLLAQVLPVQPRRASAPQTSQPQS